MNYTARASESIFKLLDFYIEIVFLRKFCIKMHAIPVTVIAKNITIIKKMIKPNHALKAVVKYVIAIMTSTNVGTMLKIK